MRTFVLPLLALVIVAGCSKNEGIDDSLSSVSHGNAKVNSRTFYENQFEAWCATPPKNCIYAITIRPGDRSGMQGVFNVVLTQNDNLIKSTFSSNYSLLSQYMYTTSIDAVIAGTRIARSTTLSDGNGNKFIIIRHTTSGTPIDIVFPMTF